MMTPFQIYFIISEVIGVLCIIASFILPTNKYVEMKRKLLAAGILIIVIPAVINLLSVVGVF